MDVQVHHHCCNANCTILPTVSNVTTFPAGPDCRLLCFSTGQSILLSLATTIQGYRGWIGFGRRLDATEEFRQDET